MSELNVNLRPLVHAYCCLSRLYCQVMSHLSSLFVTAVFFPFQTTREAVYSLFVNNDVAVRIC